MRKEISDQNAEFRQSLGLVADDGTLNWRVEFAEVFGGGRGFDIAIANPPYVQLQKDGGRLRNYTKGSVILVSRPKATFISYSSSAVARCCSLVGVFWPTSLSTAGSRQRYGKSLRRYFSEKADSPAVA